MPRQDKLDEYKRGFEAKAPKEALAVVHRATKDLAESGILARTVKVGDMAPDFVLKNTGDHDVSLGELHRTRPGRLVCLPGPLVTLLQYGAGRSQ